MPDLYTTADSVMSSMSTDLYSHLSDPAYWLEENTGLTDNIFRRDPDMYLDYLQDWDYVRGLVDLYASPMKDILSKNAYTITFTNPELTKYEDFINKSLEKLHLKDILLESLFDVIYRGAFFKVITYNKESRTFSILDTVKPWKTTYVTRLGQPLGYIRRNSHFLDTSQAVFSAYSLYRKKTVSLDSVRSAKLKQSLLDQLGTEISKEDEPDIIVYAHYSPRSVFWGQAAKLFQIYLNDFIAQFLAMKDSVRQEIFTVTVQALSKKTTNTARVAQSIEEVLNQGSNLLIQQDPRSMVAQVIFALFNGARVLPTVENYSAINNLELEKLKDKRAQLQGENEALRQQVIANLGLPEELQTGTGNRWEILSRSDRYLNAITSEVSVYETAVKCFVVSMMSLMGRFCKAEDVSFSLLNDTPLQTQMARNKSEMLNNSMIDSLNVINSVKALIGTGYVDPSKVLEEFVPLIQRYNLPFSSAYRDSGGILTDMSDPQSPVNQYSQLN